MIWYVHRNASNAIASAYSQIQPGYAEEALDDASSSELIAYIQAGATPDQSNIDNLPKPFRALGLMIANFTGKTPAQVKAAFLTAWNSLP